MTEVSLFELALNTPEAERAALLDRECGGDAGLRQRVEALLAAHARPASWLASPDATAPHEAAAAGAVIAGRYKLLQRLGEGGMGTVWMADQTEPVKRRVAVKLVRGERAQSKVILARFEAERQAIALMDHPNIARLLDAGTTEAGQPYFVMELVKGVPITEYGDTHRLTVPERLRLFVPVCQAVQHAHQKGVIHRDLKPSNVLVESHDGRPVPKVIDFGLAKAATGLQLTEHTLFTAFGGVMGTPLYMAPEQATFNAVDVDTRADVYALGVILYELLTGTTPLARDTLQKAAFDEVLRLIREQDPPAPSARLSTSDARPAVAASRQTEPDRLGRAVKGELDWIVMKALAKERERRYETASAMARDVERFLSDEPVSAGPPGAVYRFRKFLRRHRGPAITAAAVLLALLAGIAGTTYGLLRVEAGRREAEAARAAEVRQRERADELRRKAEAAAEEERKAKKQAEANLAYARKGVELLASVFVGVNTNRVNEPARPLEEVLRDSLKKAARELDGSGIADPLAVAEMRYNLGLSLDALGEYEQAAALLQKAHDAYEAGLGPRHRDTVHCLISLAGVVNNAGDLARGIRLGKAAVQRAKEVFGPGHGDTLAAMSNLATLYTDAGNRRDALPLLRETLKLRREKYGPNDLDTLISQINLAMYYQEDGKPADARPLLRDALARAKDRFGPTHTLTLTAMSNLGVLLSESGDHDEARRLTVEALKLRKQTLPPGHPDILLSMHNLADCLWAAGEPERATPLLEEALKAASGRLAAGHPQVLTIKNTLARCHQAAGRVDQAVPLFKEVLHQRRARLTPDHPDIDLTLKNLAACYREMGRPADAVPLLEEAAKRAKARPGTRPIRSALYNLATAHLEAKQPGNAAAVYDEYVAVLRGVYGAGNRQLARYLDEVSAVLLRVGEHAAAERHLRELLAILQKTYPEAGEHAVARSLLGAALLGQKKYAEAEAMLVRGIEGMKKYRDGVGVKDTNHLPEALDRLAELYASTGRPEQARKCHAERAKYPTLLPTPREVE